ncbi:MAG: Ser/Thr protein kinase RdoA (MazF antagonist) [Patescibacteria group bacterium]|jgi:Ser/Thr protein kinase RdoA (MazF antagonist)
MTHLPVSSSIISTKHLQTYLQEKYPFQQTIAVKLLKAGVNHNYLLSVGSKKYVFRIYTFNWRTTKEITAELHLLNKLKSIDLSISYPIENQEGNYLIDIPAPEGLRYGVLFSFAEGEKRLHFEEAVHEKVGRMMAQFHQATEGDQMDRVNYNAQRILMDSLPKAQRFLSKETAEMQWMIDTQKELLDLWKNADLSQIRQGSVHLDIWYDNFNITDKGEVTFFDFDFCGNGWQCLDLAYYMLQLYHTEKEETARTLKLQGFFAGYESIQKITEEERRLLPMLGLSLYYFYLGVQSDRYEDWSNVFLTEGYIKRFIELLVKGYYSNHF